MLLSEVALTSGPLTKVVSTPRSGAPNRPVHIQGELLGRGAAGSVYKMYDASTWKPVAGEKVTDITYLDNEADILVKLDHPGIVKYLSPETRMPNEKNEKIMMEYVELGGLHSVHHDEPLSPFEVAQVALQVSTTFEYLQSSETQVVHRDIEPENVLVLSRYTD